MEAGDRIAVMTHRKRTAVAVVLALAVGAGLLAWWLRAPAWPAVQVQAAPLQQSLQFSARVASASRVDLGSTLTARVREVRVQEGATVQQGQALVLLDSDELNAALAQTLASEQQAQARLAGLRSSGRQAALAAVAQAASVRVAAQADLQRTGELVAQGFLSPAKLDESQRGLAVAQAQWDAAQAQQAANAESGTDLVQAQAQLAVAQAARAAAQARLALTVLSAPTAARVLSRSVEPGQIVQPGKALLSLALSGPVQLEATVDERYLAQLQVGQRASVLADAFPATRFEATVLSLAPLVDAQRGAIEVKLALSGAAPAFLREDMSLSVEVVTARREKTRVLPLSALVSAGSTPQAQVQVVVDGRVALRPVTLGLRNLNAVEVLEGLRDGDTVLLGSTLSAGQRVRADLSVSPLDVAKAASGDAGSALTNAMGR
jgi:HlyD family secretion protein